MPKTDHAVTDLLIENGFLSKGSEVTLPDAKGNVLLFLEGPDWEAQVKRMFVRDEHRCRLCGKLLYLGQDIIDPDHITKRSKGGDDSLSNLRTLCRPCHEARHPEFKTQFGRTQHASSSEA